jgi:thiamine-monophosphate kinase
VSEFGLIARHLAPLSGEGAFGLKDDAALFGGFVLTKDVLVEGVHFLPGDPLDLVARKAVRVNLSDIIAKGARPRAYLLGLVLPKERGEQAVEAIAKGLREEQSGSGLALLGGDTTTGPCLMLSITMFGEPGPRGMVRRSGGKAGDRLFVSGTIGNGLLGLEAAQAGDAEGAMPYRLPAIPLGVEDVIAAHGSAALDISDGLIADAGHLAAESGVSLRIEAKRVPLSPAGQRASEKGRLTELLTHGDDYQALLLVPEEAVGALRKAWPEEVRLTEIGWAEPGSGVTLVSESGEVIEAEKPGWDHFA